MFYPAKRCVIGIYKNASFPDNRTHSQGRNGALSGFTENAPFPDNRNLFSPPIPDNTDNGVPVVVYYCGPI